MQPLLYVWALTVFQGESTYLQGEPIPCPTPPGSLWRRSLTLILRIPLILAHPVHTYASTYTVHGQRWEEEGEGRRKKEFLSCRNNVLVGEEQTNESGWLFGFLRILSRILLLGWIEERREGERRANPSERRRQEQFFLRG